MLKLTNITRDFLNEHEGPLHVNDMWRRLMNGSAKDHLVWEWIWYNTSRAEARARRRKIQILLAAAFYHSLEGYNIHDAVRYCIQKSVNQRTNAKYSHAIYTAGLWFSEWLEEQVDRMREVAKNLPPDSGIPRCDICLITHIVLIWRDDQYANQGKQEKYLSYSNAHLYYFLWRNVRRGRCFSEDYIHRKIGKRRHRSILSLIEMATLLELSERSIRRLLTGEATPSELAKLKKFAGYVDPEYRRREFRQWAAAWKESIAADKGTAAEVMLNTAAIREGINKGIEKYLKRREYKEEK